VSELETRLQKETDFTRYLAYNLDFRRALEIADEDPVSLARQLNENVEPNFWYFVTSDSYMKAINIYSGNVIRPVGPFLKPDTSVKNSDWYTMHQHTFYTVYRMEQDRLYATRTVLDLLTSSRAIGVLDVELFPEILFEPIQSMDYMGNGVLLVDDDGEVIAEKLSQNSHVDDKVRSAATKGGEISEIESSVILQSGIMETTGWTLFYYVDRNVMRVQLAPIILSTLLLVGAVIILALFLITLFSKHLTKRILKLKTSAKQVANGEFSELEFTQDTDEIGVVTNSFVKMAHQLQDMIRRVYKMEIEKKGSELQVLQASINPHFLYNSLSGIKWKALYSGNEDIANIASLLAAFYRTSLNNGKQITTVGSELENIKAYIDIQKDTHENQFDSVFEIDEEHIAEPMLNFMLQPLVENAIKHGIDQAEEMSERGCVIVRYKKECDYLLFSVMNNGFPLDIELVQESLNTQGKGYGLYNICQRIALYYDANSKLDVGVTEEGFTCFTLRLNMLNNENFDKN
jgi:two-component system sensor histidine kinase YesM